MNQSNRKIVDYLVITRASSDAITIGVCSLMIDGWHPLGECKLQCDEFNIFLQTMVKYEGEENG